MQLKFNRMKESNFILLIVILTSVITIPVRACLNYIFDMYIMDMFNISGGLKGALCVLFTLIISPTIVFIALPLIKKIVTYLNTRKRI